MKWHAGFFEPELMKLDIQWIQKSISEISPPNCYVEIGMRKGGSAFTAKIANKEVDVYTIDINPQLDEWKVKPETLGITVIKNESLKEAETWNKPIGVLFIDGNHVSSVGPAAKEDFYAWEKHVVKGGYILFHDYSLNPIYKDVVADCNEVSKDDRYEIFFKPNFVQHTSIFILRKK